MPELFTLKQSADFKTCCRDFDLASPGWLGACVVFWLVVCFPKHLVIHYRRATDHVLKSTGLQAEIMPISKLECQTRMSVTFFSIKSRIVIHPVDTMEKASGQQPRRISNRLRLPRPAQDTPQRRVARDSANVY